MRSCALDRKISCCWRMISSLISHPGTIRIRPLKKSKSSVLRLLPGVCWNWSITAAMDTPKEPWNLISSFLKKNTGIFSPTAHKDRISVFLSSTEYQSWRFANRPIWNGQIMKFRYCRAHFQMAWGNWLQSEWINLMSFWRLISLARAISGKKTILSTFLLYGIPGVDCKHFCKLGG